MKRTLAMLLAGAAIVAFGVVHASGHAKATLNPSSAIIQFGRMGIREMAKAGANNTDACTPLPNATDTGYSGNGTVDLFTAISRLNARYGSGGTNPWTGYGSFGGTVNTAMVYPGVSGDTNYTRESCGPHSGGTLNNIGEGTILYASWSDLASLNGLGVNYVTAGNSPGGAADGSSPYGDGTWTDVQIANNLLNGVNGTGGSGSGTSGIGTGDGHSGITTNSLGLHSLYIGESQMAWPGGVPGCTSGASSCKVTDSVNGGNLVPDEVARRMAEGCTAGATHKAYVSGVTYNSTCGSSYSSVVATNRKYSSSTTTTMNTDPLTGNSVASGKCGGANGENGCYYVKAWSLVGGKCLSTTDTCSTLSVPAANPFGGRDCGGGATDCYQQPSDLISAIDTTATNGGWFILQPYRFVEGYYRDSINPTEKKSWNCNGSAATHWTSVPETYCWNDFLTILDELATKGYVTQGVDWPNTTYRSPSVVNYSN
jgi:hypothetical protein